MFIDVYPRLVVFCLLVLVFGDIGVSGCGYEDYRLPNCTSTVVLLFHGLSTLRKSFVFGRTVSQGRACERHLQKQWCPSFSAFILFCRWNAGAEGLLVYTRRNPECRLNEDIDMACACYIIVYGQEQNF